MANTVLKIPDFQPINFTDIINNVPEVNTSGYFKEIMLAIDDNIQKEFNENRLTGTDYASVYLGAMQYALDNVFKYVLAEAINNNQAALIWAQAKKTAEELELIKAQTDKVRAEISLLNLEYEKQDLELGIAKKVEQAVVDKAYKELTQLDEQINQIKANITLINTNEALTKEKKNTEIKQQNVLVAQETLYEEQGKSFKYKHFLDTAKSLINANAVRNSSLDISAEDTGYAAWSGTGANTSALHSAIKALITGSGSSGILKWD